MSNIIFTVRNHHAPGCGSPPAIVDEGYTRRFRSYFENEHGEQWIFVHDFAEGASTIYSGDCGWENVLQLRAASDVAEIFRARRSELIEANANQMSIEAMEGLIETWGLVAPDTPVICSENGPVTLNEPERLWLEACVKSARLR